MNTRPLKTTGGEETQDGTSVAYNLNLSRNIESLGVSRKYLKLNKSKTIITESLQRRALEEDGMIYLISGSFVEGTRLPDSDVDFISQCENISVLRSPSIHPGLVFLMQTTDVRPGFTKLLLLQIGDRKHVSCMDNIVKQSLEKYDGNFYLSSEKIKIHTTAYLATQFNSKAWYKYFHLYTHGPCISSVFYRNISFEKGTFGVTESSLAIQCHEWPLSAEEWLIRKRIKEWPSKSFIAHVRSTPCFVLPVGDQFSKTKELEWRYAFVIAERELVWSFNDCQIQCYFVLKLIKSQFLKQIAGDELSSFHFKTVVFWLSEENGIEMWDTRNLIYCVVSCLKRLLLCIEELSLPHYFLRERNLMFGKFRDQRVREALINEIRAIIEIPVYYVSKYENSNKYIRDHYRVIDILNSQLSARDVRKCFEKYNFMTHKFQLNILISSIFEFVLRKYVVERTNDCMRYLDNETQDIDTRLVDACKAFIAARMLFLSLTSNFKLELTEQNRLANKACTLEGFCGYMYVATFWLKKNNLGKALSVLRKVYQKKNVLYHGLLGFDFHIETSARDLSLLSQMGKEDIAYDMLFNLTDLTCLPPAIAFELAHNAEDSFPKIKVNSIIYAHYLFFELSVGRDRQNDTSRAICNLKQFIDFMQRKEMSKSEVHRALNVLGYCYRKICLLEKALECFIQSLKLFPTARNCAAYHLAIMVNDYVKSQNLFLAAVNGTFYQRVQLSTTHNIKLHAYYMQ